MRVKTGMWMILVCMLALTFASCSPGERGPAPGTAAWYWEAAVERYGAGDYEKAQEHLAEVVDSEDPHQESAVVWRFVLLNGLASGYMELAEAYGTGAEETEKDTTPFHTLVQQYRRDARSHTISLADSVGQLEDQIEQAQTVALDFPIPPGSPNEPPVLTNIRNGVLPGDAQIVDAQTETVERAILRSAATFAGFGDDVAKTRAAFETRPVEVPTTTFSLAVAEVLLDRSILFDRKHLLELPKQAVMVDMAKKFMAPAVETEDEELKEQVEQVQDKIEKIEEEAKKPPPV